MIETINLPGPVLLCAIQDKPEVALLGKKEICLSFFRLLFDSLLFCFFSGRPDVSGDCRFRFSWFWNSHKMRKWSRKLLKTKMKMSNCKKKNKQKKSRRKKHDRMKGMGGVYLLRRCTYWSEECKKWRRRRDFYTCYITERTRERQKKKERREEREVKAVYFLINTVNVYSRWDEKGELFFRPLQLLRIGWNLPYSSHGDVYLLCVVPSGL